LVGIAGNIIEMLGQESVGKLERLEPRKVGLARKSWSGKVDARKVEQER